MISFPFLVLLLLFSVDTVLVHYCSDDELYVIRSVGSNGQFVLDGSQPPDLKLQYFTGLSPQLWKFKQGTKPGLYYIINNDTRNALDIVRTDQTFVVMSKEKDTLQQQWILNSNGRIVNGAARMSLWFRNHVSGQKLIMVRDSGYQGEEFSLQLLHTTTNVDVCKYLL